MTRFVAAGGLLAWILIVGGLTPVEARQGVVPQGSYLQSCSGTFVNQGRLYSNCRNRQGNNRPSSIELAACTSSDIGNDDGLLVCAGVRGRAETNGGRAGAQAILYPDAFFGGTPVTLTAATPNMGTMTINDRVSSMRLTGVWTVCTNASYGGSCRSFRGDHRNLDSTFNDAISAMRPQ